eukprot:CAMPEP_0206043946 /NCGR_PEP_ID=MMETSP1466-20131121/10881_1 /ASSEMBLY_ACC=CAM_ASM_001126 /TAXON_ID=44452 /ORGANISM="Pavlova gyrans, Strain CCMP608" /LENGTH=267 /DNA_ID=CAMNT_0053418813 /DNA_START=33 /DNA_END=836 /DNA_ORIENTATION=+
MTASRGQNTDLPPDNEGHKLKMTREQFEARLADEEERFKEMSEQFEERFKEQREQLEKLEKEFEKLEKEFEARLKDKEARLKDKDELIEMNDSAIYTNMQALSTFRAILENEMLIERCLRVKYPNAKETKKKLCKKFVNEVAATGEGKAKIRTLADQLGCEHNNLVRCLEDVYASLVSQVFFQVCARVQSIGLVSQGWCVGGGGAHGCVAGILVKLLMDDETVIASKTLPRLGGETQVFFLNKDNMPTHILKPGQSPIPLYADASAL